MMANNCLKCKSEIPDDRLYCDECLKIFEFHPGFDGPGNRKADDGEGLWL